MTNRKKSTAIPNERSKASASAREQFQAFLQVLNSILLKPRTMPVPRWITPRHYSLTLSECFGHASFILVAVSYATDDFLMLRCIAVVGSSSMLFFTYFHPHGKVLWLPFRWNVLFIAINSYRIGRILLERNMARHLSEEMVRLHDEHFRVCDIVDFAKLLRIAEEVSYDSGDLVVCQGSMTRHISVVIEGELAVLRDGVCTYLLEEGNFVNEAGLHAGLMLEGEIESSATIVADLPQNLRELNDDTKHSNKIRILRWDRTELVNLLRNDKGLHRSIKAALSWDIVRKLKAQRQMLAMGLVDDPEHWTKIRQHQNEDRYAAILHNILSHPGRINKEDLEHYRKIHNIDDEHHLMALDQCGWTKQEFERGERSRGVDDDEEGHVEVPGWDWRRIVSRFGLSVDF